MVKKKMRGFTLIELIAVLVIMAIIALIVTPLVMNIIRKAKTAADKRSIDAYGRSIEIAIAGYLLDTGTFPTSMNQLTVEYNGDEVVCSTTQIKSDSSVYLAGCTVGGREVKDYTYGSEEAAPTYTAYKVGDEVKYNNVDYYVIADSGVNQTNVTLLKKTPLTVTEVNTYGEGHVNMNVPSGNTNYQTASDENGYGGMAYYTSETCGYVNGNYIETGCTTDYVQSEIKYVVDAWKAAKAPAASEVRLMTYDEFEDLSEVGQVCTGSCYDSIVAKYTWMKDVNYNYWLGTPDGDSANRVWFVVGYGAGRVDSNLVNYDGSGGGIGVVRPVIVLSKSLISA